MDFAGKIPEIKVKGFAAGNVFSLRSCKKEPIKILAIF